MGGTGQRRLADLAARTRRRVPRLALPNDRPTRGRRGMSGLRLTDLEPWIQVPNIGTDHEGRRQALADCPVCSERLWLGIDGKDVVWLSCGGGHPDAEIWDGGGSRNGDRSDAEPAPEGRSVVATPASEIKPERVRFL